MRFADKLKSIRTQAGMSQEKLAEKLGVSRQAVTKWETNGGIPDIENLMAISALFHITIDELLSNEKEQNKKQDYLYESITEYDIDYQKHYDMKFGGAKLLIMSGYEGEKIRIRLASNTLETLQSDFKLKIDDIKGWFDNKRGRIDLNIVRKDNVTEALAKEALSIFISLPNNYMGKIELAVNAQNIELHSLECESIELDVRTEHVVLDNIVGTVEIDCNMDMNIICGSLNGAVEINQVSATSRIRIPEETLFTAVKKGVKTSIFYEENGKQSEAFSTPDADNVIELNGINSELIISR